MKEQVYTDITKNFLCILPLIPSIFYILTVNQLSLIYYHWLQLRSKCQMQVLSGAFRNYKYYVALG